MLVALDETTGLIQRTITSVAWAKATNTTPSCIEDLDTSINAIMAELIQSVIHAGDRYRDCGPWIRPTEPCSGVMWASVPNMVECKRDAGDGWIISTSSYEMTSSYLRISPAPEGDTRIQYGFCPIRLNKLKELKQATWGEHRPLMSRLSITVTSSSRFRCDKMVTAAVSLFSPVSSTPESRLFRELLGRRSMGVFVKDMLRGCYTDSCESRNILNDRDTRYREMMELVVDRAYPSWKDPATEEDLARLRHVMSLDGEGGWNPHRVWPYVYNVVMPRAMFEANSRNLERGIPPIIPHYVTPLHWMFNGGWTSPCTGLEFRSNCGVGRGTRKIIAGILAKSNLDLPGGVSIWPIEDNPPQEWVDKFVGCIEDVGNLEMPLDMQDKSDLVLHESHNIPLMFRVYLPEAPRTVNYKFMRLSYGRLRRVDHDTQELEGMGVRECSPGGGEWIGEEVTSETNASSTATVPPIDDEEDEDETSDECRSCEVEISESETYSCTICGYDFCRGCVERCSKCDEFVCVVDCSHMASNGQTTCNGCNA